MLRRSSIINYLRNLRWEGGWPARLSMEEPEQVFNSLFWADGISSCSRPAGTGCADFGARAPLRIVNRLRMATADTGLVSRRRGKACGTEDRAPQAGYG